MSLIETTMTLFQPYALQYFMDWYESFVDGDTTSARDGWLWGCLFAGSLFIQCFMLGHANALGWASGVRIRAGLIGSLYNKILGVSPGIMSDPHASAVVQIVFTDSQRLVFFVSAFHFIVQVPVSIIVSLALLIERGGILTALGMLGGALLVAPAIVTFIVMVQRYFMRQMAAGDERINRFTEVLNSVHIIKLMGLEGVFKRAIEKLRVSELHHMKRATIARLGIEHSFGSLIWFALGATVSVFSYRPGGKFSPQLFGAVTLLARTSLVQLGSISQVVALMADALVSIRRINAFMSLPDLVSRERGECPEGIDVQIDATEAVFAPPTNLGSLVEEQ